MLSMLLLIAARALAQNNEVAYPLISNFTDKNYNAQPNNYAIVQDQRGIMYFGNNKGLLEFDGVKWHLYALPGNPAVRSLAVDKNGRLFLGADDDFGYLASDSTGKLAFTSLADTFRKKAPVGSITSTFATADGVYFISLGRVYQYNGKTTTEVVLKNALVRQPGFSANGTVYINESGLGPQQLVGSNETSMQGMERLKDESLQFMLPMGDNKLLIGTRYQGMFTYDGKTLTPFKTPADQYLQDNILASGCKLADDLYAIGTVQGGVAVVAGDGSLKYLFTKLSGMVDNTANALYGDKQHGLWVASDNGISHIDLFSPAAYYKESSNLMGNVTGIVRNDGTIYVTTSQGIYFLRNPDVRTIDFAYGFHSFFKSISGFITDYHDMMDFDNCLLLATTDGLYDLHNNIPVKVFNDKANLLYRPNNEGDKLYVALQDSLIALQKSGEKWTLTPLIQHVNASVTSMVQEGQTLWLTTKTKGVLKLSFTDGNNGPIIDSVGPNQGLPKSRYLHLFGWKDIVLLSTDQGLYQLDPKTGKFVATDIFGKDFNKNKAQLLAVNQLSDGSLFIVTDIDKGIAIAGQNGQYVYNTTFYSQVADPTYTTAYVDKNDVVWLGGSKGIIVINTKQISGQDHDKDFTTLLRKVQLGDGKVLFDNAFPGKDGMSSMVQENGDYPSVSFKNNAIRFDFAAANYDQKAPTEYQFMLEGFDNQWSEWSVDTRKDYTNLPEGKYFFQVRARNAYGQISKVGGYHFTILPPWYRTWWAYLLGLLLVGGIIYLAFSLRSRQLQLEKKKLQVLVDERTKELHESQDRLVEQQKLASLGQLTAGIAHEIKNPLNFVNNFAELSDELLQELAEDIDKQKAKIDAKDFDYIQGTITDLRHNVQKINEHGKRADNIVKGMLMHSRSQSGEKEAVDLNTMVEENVNLAYRGLRGKNSHITVQFEKHLDPTIGNIQVIRQDLSRVFLNIANNAIYAAFKQKESKGGSFEPTVTFSTKNLSADKVEVRIRDNGTGISEENLSKIFNPFFTTKPTGEGTGLGLSMSYDIVVKGHGGSLTAESKEGEYTEFIIVLSKK